jgi:ethanolamine utilization protein EutN
MQGTTDASSVGYGDDQPTMRIGEVIGTVTLSRSHPSMASASFRLAVPLTLDNLRGASADRAEAFVVYDEFGAGVGSRIAISEGGEAAQPFRPHDKPVDAYNAAILDTITLGRND